MSKKKTRSNTKPAPQFQVDNLFTLFQDLHLRVNELFRGQDELKKEIGHLNELGPSNRLRQDQFASKLSRLSKELDSIRPTCQWRCERCGHLNSTPPFLIVWLPKLTCSACFNDVLPDFRELLKQRVLVTSEQSEYFVYKDNEGNDRKLPVSG